MYKIYISILRYALEYTVMLFYVKGIPAHMRYFESTVIVRYFCNASFKQTESLYSGTFFAFVKKQLQSETYSEKRFTAVYEITYSDISA